MELLSDDPTYLAGGLGILAVIFLVALRVTQQGKFLIWAGASLALAALLVLVEYLWVTDTERIEQVVYDLRGAVAASDAPAVFALLTPDVQFAQQGQSLSGDETRSHISARLGQTEFDFIRIIKLEANAGRQSGRGSAQFRVLAGGSYKVGAVGTLNFGTINLDFSLGFRELSPKVWRVERITLTRAPRDMPDPGRSVNESPPRLPNLKQRPF
ncbi:hypothetical protein [Singulisphaera acidiphila]|uniref:DUF4440 domain-containing protein n=1 Tax=Singulisphaera acidiphila (strain ATCC BAA-1392 / DSM 18658 / VKM B-2454 / MOB10) TaxID=886293 RepID=L0D6R1_SINAD|nr:hypothetical protein [Singulisphaera acidiphila]AGA24555.1 hypothetical protein Sinac_0094 [Singulisphaera acidiphila DSM 18658]